MALTTFYSVGRTTKEFEEGHVVGLLCYRRKKLNS